MSQADVNEQLARRSSRGNANVSYGAVNPTTEGNNGDFYINTVSHTIFGPKAAGVWPAGTALVGTAGATGATGAAGSTGATGAVGAAGHSVLYGSADPGPSDGSNGDFWVNTTAHTFFGPKASGLWPSGNSLIGPTGATGATGSAGATGAAGVDGGAIILAFPSANNASAGYAPGTYFTSPGGGINGGVANAEGYVNWICPRSGTISKLYIRTGPDAKTGSPVMNATVRKNGVDTALTAAVTQTINSTSSDTTHSFSVAEGDIITLKIVVTGTGVSVPLGGASCQIQ